MNRRYRRILDLRLGGRRRIDAEMDDEIESHVAMRAADLVRGGMAPDDARREALRRFGDFTEARRRLHAGARQREASKIHRDWLGSVRADLAYALRQWRRAPGFTGMAIGALALGIAATTTVFTLVDRVLLRPLPFPASERIVSFEGLDSARSPTGSISQRDWLDWRRAPSLASSAIYGIPRREAIVLADSALRVTAQHVTGAFFGVLRARFVTGRAFTASDVEAGTPLVVVSERLWHQLYGSDTRLDRPLRTADRSYTIAGVLAAGQEFPAGTDVWFPIADVSRFSVPRININWYGIGRLRDGVPAERAATEMSTIARAVLATDPTALYDHGVAVTPLASALAGPAAEYLRLLMGAVLFVLLIVCANVAAAALARAASRSREMAVRASLGAVRGRLIQQMAIEHATLGLAGGVLGIFAAWAAVRGIVARWGDQIPRAAEISPDARIVAVAIVASLVAGIAAGMVPAFRATSSSPRDLLASGGRTSVTGGRNLAGSSLVTLEIALALLLVTGAGLLIRSFRSVMERDLGFDTNVATAEVALSGPRFIADTIRRSLYWDALLGAYRQIAGVSAVGLSQVIPLGRTGIGLIEIGGRSAPPGSAVYRAVDGGFFSVLRIPLLVGRVFDERDALGGARVAVVNQTMARRYWPGESPIGKQVRAISMEPSMTGGLPPWLTIVGIVGDVRTSGLETEPRAEMYVHYKQVPIMTYTMTALVRGPGRASLLTRDLRRVARAVDAQVPADVGTLDGLLQRTLAVRTLTLSLLSTFAVVALVLAALGIYGVLSYAVTRRTRELAVRAALGAQRGALLRLVVASGLRVVVPGMVLGIAAAVALTRTLESMLVGVTHVDAATYIVAIIGLGVVCVLAIVVPARRATRLNPLIALQAE